MNPAAPRPPGFEEGWAMPWPEPLTRPMARLRECLIEQAPLAIALSGGQDSAWLLAASVALHRTVRSPAPRAFTIRSPLLPDEDLDHARRLCAVLSVPHHELDLNPLDVPPVRENHPDRCYHCKRFLFEALLHEARRLGVTLADGTHAEDCPEERPGMRALEELGVLSPLRLAGFGRGDIAASLRRLNLDAWVRPPSSCLATRFPFGEALTPECLARVDAAERGLRALGFQQCRVRWNGGAGRVEVPAADEARLASPVMRPQVDRLLRELGFS